MDQDIHELTNCHNELCYIKTLWEKFADIPIDDDECIEEDFHIWEKGTDRFDIWHWFDEMCPNGLAKDLMKLN